MASKKLLFCYLLVHATIQALNAQEFCPVPANDPCNRRSCETNSQPQTCRMVFVIEKFYTMHPDWCRDCPFNQRDCYNRGCVTADGWLRDITTINRMLPGPSIQVCEGDLISVTVVNRLPDASTSIHWHGIHQRATPHMDGVPMLTQCPIPPGTNFTYEFTPDTVGTMFYHSHSGFQKDDGVYGPLIIRQPRSLETISQYYDEDLPEHVIIVSDWLHLTTESDFMEQSRPDAVIPPIGIVVNGRGANMTFGDGVQTPLPYFNVTSGRRYRFRFISSGVLACPIHVSVDGHRMTVIASDGSAVEPVEVDLFTFASGERYDMVINANQPAGNYWIKFRGSNFCEEGGAFQYAVLHYNGASDAFPTEPRSYENADREGLELNPDDTVMRNGTNIPVVALNAAVDAIDKRISGDAGRPFIFFVDAKPINLEDFVTPCSENLPIRTVRDGDQRLTFPMNNISFRFPSYPPLTQPDMFRRRDYCNWDTVDHNVCGPLYCECPHLVDLNLNSNIEIVVADLGVRSNVSHPFHLHGYYFHVVAMEKLGDSTTIEAVLASLANVERKLDRPPRKDTINIPDGGYVVLRFYADNPGFWFFHCHLGLHLEIGMAMIFRVGHYHDIHLPDEPFSPPQQCGHPENSPYGVTSGW